MCLKLSVRSAGIVSSKLSGGVAERATAKNRSGSSIVNDVKQTMVAGAENDVMTFGIEVGWVGRLVDVYRY